MEKETLSNPILWSPSNERVKSSQMFRFLQNINEKYDLNLDSFSELHNWSIENKSEFWTSIWDFFKIIGSKGTEPYIEPANKMPGSKFFPNGSVNYAENMLSLGSPLIDFSNTSHSTSGAGLGAFNFLSMTGLPLLSNQPSCVIVTSLTPLYCLTWGVIN